MFYYLLKYVLLGPLLRLLFRPRIEGLEHIPESGAAIVAGNHLSFSDHFLMPADPQAAHHLPREGRVLHRAPASRAG